MKKVKLKLNHFAMSMRIEYIVP